MDKLQDGTEKELLFLGRMLAMESKLESLEKTIQEKIEPQQQEYLHDDDLEKIYGFTKAVRNKLVAQGKIKRYKPSGKASASLYLRKEVEKAIASSVFFPKEQAS